MKISAPLRLLLCGVLGTAAIAPAQQVPDAEPPPEDAALPPGPIGTVQIATRARVLADSATHAEQTIERLRAVEGLTAEVEDARRRDPELQALQTSMIDTDFVRLKRLSRLRDQALIADGRLEEVRKRLIDRLAEVGEFDARWVER